MARENNRYEQIMERLKNTYRLVVMNDDTFEEIGSYRLTRLNLYILLSSLFVLMVILVTSFILFTPIKQYIPGYGDIDSDRRVIKLAKQVNEIEREVKARTVYIESVKKMLTNDVEYIPDKAPEEIEIPDTILDIEPIPEDYQLRTEVEREELLSINTPSSTVNITYNEDVFNNVYLAAPIKGAVISDEFQPTKDHFGIDLTAPTNTPILAATNGVVFMADWTFETGYTLGIQHDNNLVTFYKHNSKLLKSVGDVVKASEAVAIIGNTGEFSFGAHLHFEVWHNNRPVNPKEYISF